jgi:hypothetical protein
MIRGNGKALRYINFKAAWWFIPVIFAELVAFYGINLVTVGIELVSYKDEFILYSLYGLRNIFIVETISITLIAMSAVLFYLDRRTPSAAFAASMPYSKKEVFLNKWVVGAYNIVAAFFTAYVALSIILINKSLWKVFFIELTLWTVVTMLMYLFIFSFIMMVQTACNSTWFGTLTTTLIAALPIVFMLLVYSQYIRYDIFHIVYTYRPDFLPENLMEGTAYKLFAVFYSLYSPHYHGILDYSILSDSFYCSETFTFIRCAAYIILTIVFMGISIIIYKRNNAGNITGIAGMQILFKLIISFYISMIILASIALIKGFVRFDWIIVFGFIIPLFIYMFALSQKKPWKRLTYRFAKSYRRAEDI